MEQALTVIVIVLVFIGTFLVSSNRKFEKRLLSRGANEPKNLEQFYASDQIEVATSLKKILSNHVSVDLKYVRPEDEICSDLGLGNIDAMDVDDFVGDVEKEFNIKISEERAANILTLQELVDEITLLRRAKQ